MTLRSFPAPPGEVHLVSTVQGLASERDVVAAAFDRVQPAALALGLSPEQVAALQSYSPKEDEDLFDDLPDHEALYAARLQAFGEIGLPPPDLMEAIRIAGERGVPVRGVDLTQEQYEDAFTSEVGWFALLRYGRLQRKLGRKPPRASDARAFSLAWDARVRRVRALDRVEARREDAMSARASTLARETGGPVLLLVDAPREAGVAQRLAAQENVQGQAGAESSP